MLGQAYDLVSPTISKVQVPSHNLLFNVALNGKNKYVVKVFSKLNFTPLIKGRDSDHINYEYAILNILKINEAPVASVASDNQGNGIHEIRSLKAIVFPFIEGTFFTGSIQEIGYAADSLARVHSALVSDGLPACDFDHQSFLEFWIRRLHKLSFEGNSDSSSLIYRLVSEVENILGRTDQWKDLVWVHGHGDVNPRNFIYRGDQAFLIDFQAARLMPRLGDIADGMIEFGITMNSVDKTRMDHFLASYQLTNPLTEIEMNNLNSFLLCDSVAKIGSMLQNEQHHELKISKPRMDALQKLTTRLLCERQIKPD